MREYVIQKVLEEKVIAIVRGVDPEACLKTADALYAGGIRMMEVTFNQSKPESFEETAQAIAAISKAYEGRMLVGAGTVTTPELVDMAAKAGAKYIISPDCNEEVIRYTRQLGLVSMPGALTPSEITAAYRAGADFVKVFPAGNMGPAYIKAVRAPLSHIPLLAVGGVSEKNVAEYLKMGCVGAGIGGNLANKEWIAAGEFHKITQVAAELVKAVREA